MIPPVSDGRVWNSVRWLYFGSGLLFLANISLGILNVFSPANISRGQVLAHFHAGTIGWVTLSVIATALWVFTGRRDMTQSQASLVAGLTTVALLSVAGYIAAFGLAFNGDGPFWLLPLFGVPTWLVILAATGFVWAQFRQLPVVTTVHLLFFGALLVASLGATMGILQGLSYSLGRYPGPADANGLGAHAAPMDMYLALAFAGFIELQLRRDDARRWTRPGMTQMVLGTAGGFIAAISLYFNAPQLVGAALLAFLVGFGFYFGRIGWRTFTVNPFRRGRNVALFWGGVAYPIYVVAFVALVALFFIPGKELPHEYGVIFVHLTFVGAGTNLILATQSAYTARPSRLEALAFWLLNLGLLAFIASELAAGRREGALIMALGVIASLLVVWLRLGEQWTPEGAVMAPKGQRNG